MPGLLLPLPYRIYTRETTAHTTATKSELPSLHESSSLLGTSSTAERQRCHINTVCVTFSYQKNNSKEYTPRPRGKQCCCHPQMQRDTEFRSLWTFCTLAALPIFQENLETQQAERTQSTKSIGENPTIISLGMSKTWIGAANSVGWPSFVSFHVSASWHVNLVHILMLRPTLSPGLAKSTPLWWFFTVNTLPAQTFDAAESHKPVMGRRRLLIMACLHSRISATKLAQPAWCAQELICA